MRKLLSLFTCISLVLIAGLTLMSYSSGSPGGRTGSPGDFGICTNCHSGVLNSGPGNTSISTNIPAAGYLTDSTYTITVTVNESGINKFGFEATAEDNIGQKKGGMLITNSTATQLTNGGNAVTHKSTGTSGSGSKSWSFDWKAPPIGVGDITFYAAYNAANNNGTTTGDNIYTDQHTVPEDSGTFTGLADAHKGRTLKLYPIPAEDHLFIQLDDRKEGFSILELRDLFGKLVKQARLFSNKNKLKLDLSTLKPGVYFISLKGESHAFTEKIILK